MGIRIYASYKSRTLGELKGELHTPGRSNWSPVASFSLNSVVPLDLPNGRSARRRTHAPIVITKEHGAATPQLLAAYWNHEVFDEVQFEIAGRPDTGKQGVAQKITLTNAVITHARVHVVRASSGRGISEFAFQFERIQTERP